MGIDLVECIPMRLSGWWRCGFLLFALGVSWVSASPAEEVPAHPATITVRAVRLTFVAGAVSVQRSDNTAEDSPVLNMPLTEGTRLVTGDYGQAEIEFEDGSVARLTPRSSISLDSLTVAENTAKTSMTVLGGLVYLELRKSSVSQYRVDVSGMQISPVENTVVRVKVDDPPAAVTVLVGSARLEKVDGFRLVVRQGESLRPEDQDAMRFALTHDVPEESWDRWNESRDQMAADEADRRTTARNGFAGAQGYGWSDLDANGSWYDLPGSGQVWQPAAADEAFDPYGNGAWAWSGNGGYVFASGYSWGWTPYRCGRWEFIAGFGWGWIPGRSCGNWGYAGPDGGAWDGGGWDAVRVGRGPAKYRPVRIPLPGPGKVHPIVPVHGPDGARPPVLRGEPIKIVGVMREPLRPIGNSGSRSGSSLGKGLTRDYPVDARSGQPVFGVEPGAVTFTAAGDRSGQNRQVPPLRPEPPANLRTPRTPGVTSVFRSTQEEQTAHVHNVAPPAAAPAVPAVHTPMAPPAAVPVVRTPMPAPANVPPPARTPVQSAPAPQPVRSAPAPSAPAPARDQPAKANPK